MNAVQKLSTMYTEREPSQSPSMLYSPAPGYTLSYPGNHDSRPIHPLLRGGSTRSERGKAAEYREKYVLRGDMAEDTGVIVHDNTDAPAKNSLNKVGPHGETPPDAINNLEKPHNKFNGDTGYEYIRHNPRQFPIRTRSTPNGYSHKWEGN